MNTTIAEPSAFAIDMDRAHSQRVIEHALRVRAETSIWPRTQDDERPISGPLAGRTDAGLVIQATLAGGREPLVSEYCEAGFRLEDARFMFTSNILDVAASANGCRLEIALPDCIQVLQRRRYQRRDLRGNAVVRITPLHGGSRDSIEAALLNMSPCGLACRCRREAADRLMIDAPVRVSFRLRENDQGFAFDGRVCSKTAGAKSDHLILAIEFAAGAELRQDSERLAEALYGPVLALTRG